VSVQEDAAAAGFAIASVSPNPATSVVRLNVTSANAQQNGTVVLVSTDGREIVLRAGVALLQGTTTLELPLNAVASGSYQIGVRVGSHMIVAPLAIVR
jgi:hypothetical protein